MTEIFIYKQVWIIFALATLYGFEHFAPYYLGRGKVWKHDVKNVAMGIINIGITTLLFSSLTVYSTERLSENGFGLLRMVDLPRGIDTIIAIIAIDLFFYWWHRLNHRIGFLWLFHRMHHSDPGMNVSSSYRFHIVEVALSLASRLGLIMLLGIDSYSVFLYEMIFSPIVYFQHSNINIKEKVDRYLRIIISSPHMHRIHHSVKQPETDSNYGSVFSFWDRLFRSFRLVENPRAIVQGLTEFQDESSQTMLGMLKTPFVRVQK